MLAGAEAAFYTENDPTDVPVCRYLNVLNLKPNPTETINYLLHLELDSGLQIVGLSSQVIVMGHQGGELASLNV